MNRTIENLCGHLYEHPHARATHFAYMSKLLLLAGQLPLNTGKKKAEVAAISNFTDLSALAGRLVEMGAAKQTGKPTFVNAGTLSRTP